MSHNRHEMIGRLGADPEVRRGNNGDTIVTMRIVTSDTWRDRTTGEKKEKSEWHSVVIFNQHIAKTAEQYLKRATSFSLRARYAPANGKIRAVIPVIRQRRCWNLMVVSLSYCRKAMAAPAERQAPMITAKRKPANHPAIHKRPTATPTRAAVGLRVILMTRFHLRLNGADNSPNTF